MPPGGEPLPQLVTRHPVGVRRQQFGDVPAGWAAVVVDGRQCRHRLPDALPVLIGLHHELGDTGALDRCDGGDFGVLVEQQQLFEPDVAHLTAVAEHRFGCGQGHFAVGGSRVGGHVVDLVVGQPRQLPGADVGLPGVPLGLLRQPHVLAQQRVHRGRARTARLGVLAVGLDEEVPVGPGRQRRVDQPPARIQDGEIDCGAGAVQVGEEDAQSVRQRLVAPHAGERHGSRCRRRWRSARRRASAGGAGPARRTPGGRLPAPPAPPLRTAPAAAGCRPSSRRRRAVGARGFSSVAE